MKTIALLALLTCACDSTELVEDDLVEVRQEPDEVLIGTEQVTVADFAGLVAACADVEKDLLMTVTLTSYPFGAENRVVGIGASTLAGLELYNCWKEQVVKLEPAP